MSEPRTEAKSFPCPKCNSLRESHTADCPFCGWRHREQPAEDSSPLQQLPCPGCGGTDYWWGAVSTGIPLHTEEESPPWWEMLRLHVKPLRLRKCRRCGNVQFFADVNA